MSDSRFKGSVLGLASCCLPEVESWYRKRHSCWPLAYVPLLVAGFWQKRGFSLVLHFHLCFGLVEHGWHLLEFRSNHVPSLQQQEAHGLLLLERSSQAPNRALDPYQGGAQPAIWAHACLTVTHVLLHFLSLMSGRCFPSCNPPPLDGTRKPLRLMGTELCLPLHHEPQGSKFS